MGDYPITVTSIGCLFLSRVVGPGETSLVTCGFEKARESSKAKGALSQVTTDQKVQLNNQLRYNMPEVYLLGIKQQENYIFARALAG
jgi:hypothetical protein